MRAAMMKLYCAVFRRRPERPVPASPQDADLPASIFADAGEGLLTQRGGRGYRLFFMLGGMAASNPP
jgi:hypothetical protein